MFSKWFKKKSSTSNNVPEVMGLYLGGSFELDELKLRLLEPALVSQGIAAKQVIQAVGEAHLDSGGKLLRFYTDDDAFLQVALDGGDTEQHITDVKLWHFYNTQTVGNESQWNTLIRSDVSRSSYTIEGQEYTRVWDAIGDESPPVAVTEKTYELDGDVSETDQFMMLYERQIEGEKFESLLVCAEEKLVDSNYDRCLVISTGIDISPADIKING